MTVDDLTVRRHAVKGWVFMDLPEEEQKQIRSFLDGGDPGVLPQIWQQRYALALARQQGGET